MQSNTRQITGACSEFDPHPSDSNRVTFSSNFSHRVCAVFKIQHPLLALPAVGGDNQFVVETHAVPL